MKKLITLLLALAGMVGTASADYYLFYGTNYDAAWESICTLTEESEGVYSSILNLEDESLLGWGSCTVVLSTQSTLGDQWSNVIWPNLTSRTSILSSNSFTLGSLQSGNEGKLYIPITEITPNTYAIKITYTESTSQLSATRLIEFASSNDNWHTSTPVYLPETGHSTGIFTDELTLPANTEFKFVVNGNSNDKSGQVLWYGYNSGTYISEGNNVSNIMVSNAGTYTITANLSNYNYVAPSLITVTAAVGEFGMATLSSKYALDFTSFNENSSVRAYTISGVEDASTGELAKTLVNGNKVPAETGLYIEGSTGASINVPTTIYTTAVEGNLLKAQLTSSKINKTDGINTNFILTVNTLDGTKTTPKFYKVNDAGNDVSAGKAYLQLPTAIYGSRPFVWFEETTNINTIEQELYNNGQTYNLAGQRVSQPTKGLYIVNGKKIIK